jgi:aryl-alcohol dehydrogenase-like predicted oxidoreductase
MEERTPVPRRPLPGSPLHLSALSLSLDPTGPGPALDRAWATLAQQAYERGVTTFDLSTARNSARAERILATAFGTSDRPLVVLLGRSGDDLGPTGPRTGGTADADSRPARSLARSLRASAERLPPSATIVCVWRPDRTQRPVTLPLAVGERATEPDTRIHGWALALEDPALPSADDPADVPTYSGELSLLDLRLVNAFEGSGARPGAALIATDPFAGGRLDGSRFSASLADRSPTAEPPSLRTLHTEFDPILALGFLTDGRKRTLAQAAVEFPLSFPWVASVAVPMPSPERLGPLLAAAAGPPLSPGERDRVLGRTGPTG